MIYTRAKRPHPSTKSYSYLDMNTILRLDADALPECKSYVTETVLEQFPFWGRRTKNLAFLNKAADVLQPERDLVN